MMQPKINVSTLYPMTTEEYFVICRSDTLEAAEELLKAFRAEQQRTADIVKWMMESADPKWTGMSDLHRERMKDAAMLIREMQSNISLLRGWIAGMESRNEQ
jgi:hypothetical protein